MIRVIVVWVQRTFESKIIRVNNEIELIKNKLEESILKFRQDSFDKLKIPAKICKNKTQRNHSLFSMIFGCLWSPLVIASSASIA